MLIGGTLVDEAGFAGSSLVISNETSGSWFITNPTTNWGPELTEVAQPTNIIKAIYYNGIGQKTSDFIKVINGPAPTITLIYPADGSIIDVSNTTMFIWLFENLHNNQDVFLDGNLIGSSNGFLKADVSPGKHYWWVVAYDDAGDPVSSKTNEFDNVVVEKYFAIWQAGFGFDDEKHGGATFNWTEPAPVNSRIQVIGAPNQVFPLQIPGQIIGSNNFLIRNTAIGQGQSLLDGYKPGAGEFAAAAVMNYLSNKYVVVRSFSSSNVSDAAYFDQSIEFSPWYYDKPYPLECLVNTLVNPAYLIPDLDIHFPDTEPLDNLLEVYGFTATGYGDNQLRDYQVIIEWENFTINTSGFFDVEVDLFDGKIPILTNLAAVVTNHIAFRTVGFSDVDELPAGNWQNFYIPNIVAPEPPEILSPIYIAPGASNSVTVSNSLVIIEGLKFQKNEFVVEIDYGNSNIFQDYSSKDWSQSLELEFGSLVSISYCSTNIIGKSKPTVIYIDVVPEPCLFIICYFAFVIYRRFGGREN